MRLCTDLGLNDAQEYATKLKKAEKNKELREQVRNLIDIIIYSIGIFYKKTCQFCLNLSMDTKCHFYKNICDVGGPKGL